MTRMLLMRRVGNRNWSDLELPGMMVLPVFSMGNWWNQSEYLYITSILPSKYTQNQRGSIQFEPPKPQRGTKICNVKLVFLGSKVQVAIHVKFIAIVMPLSQPLSSWVAVRRNLWTGPIVSNHQKVSLGLQEPYRTMPERRILSNI